uniref:PPM-type phosphatase domain-containing protein n=1 Tax=Ganoderma boninense TaxID=34458 RepID=A0A5K1JZS6_9APHY|nr:PPM-type phosphatase domain-containing protein [Ganoderma boninense]
MAPLLFSALMSSQPSSNPSTTRPKHRRSSHPKDPAAASQADAAVSKDAARDGLAKRHRANATPLGEAAGDTLDEVTNAESEPAVDSDQPEPDAEATDGSVDTVHARVRRARQTRLLSAEERRTRFLAKYAGRTAEQILDAVARGWRLKVYEHFQPPTILRGEQGSVTYWFTCKRFPSKHVDRSDYEDSTGNLKRHVDICDPEPTPESKTITVFANGATYSPTRMCFLLAMWCVSRHRPFKVVEDPEFCAMLGMLYGKVHIPSQVTVFQDVQLILDETMARLIDRFENLPGKIHLCVDGWTSPNVMNFLGVTAHWQEAGVMRHVILDFIRLTKSHTGVYLSCKLLECMRKWGIKYKVLAVTCDSTSNNDKMLDEMSKEFPLFRGKKVRVRCFGHVLNLVVKACISGFQGKQSAEKSKNEFETAFRDVQELSDNDIEGEEVSDDEADDAHEQADDEAIADVDDTHPELADTSDEYAAPRAALNKILKLSTKVWNNPNVHAEMSRLAKEAGLQSDVLIWPVITRWNTVCAVLDRALDMEDIVNEVCDQAQFNRHDGVWLHCFLLSEEEWRMLDDLYRLLDPFAFATRQILHSNRALVHEVIPYMDALTEHLDKFSEDESLTPAVRMAAKRGRILLDKYYGLTDETIIHRIAMILHPRYKTSYFCTQEWPEEWISEAVDIIRGEWTSRYKPATPPADKGKDRAPRPSAHVPGPGRRSAAASMTRALFESIARGPSAENQDTLEAYLEAPPLVTVEDPIKYWELRAQTESNPALARMALDFLSIPATSTDIERVFSRGRLTVSCLRYALGDKSVRVSTLLGSWARIPDLVCEQDIVALIKNGRVAPLPTLSQGGAATVANVSDGPDSDIEVVAGPSSSSRVPACCSKA